MRDIDSRIGRSHTLDSVKTLLDESGDLGFTQNSSKTFVVAAMSVQEPDNFNRLTKNARNKLGKKRCMGELKFNSALDQTRTLILNGVAKNDCQIAWVSFDKNRVPMALRADKHRMYLMACDVVLPELFRRVPARRMNIMMDKHFSKKWERDELNEHVSALLAEYHFGNFTPQFQVSQFDSESKKELQVHDFVVGAIFQQVERDISKYYSIIENKIVYRRKII